jgi:CDP-diacylglycerol--glycerol-3-phosphate 3-phosphatidyltransferase
MQFEFYTEKILIILQITVVKKNFWTIPNILTLYRILMFPLILYWIYADRENRVGIFIAISLFTDWLDGIIARAWKIQTELGARMDSWADLGTYICAFLAIYFFKWEEIKPHLLIGYIFLGVWLLSYLVVFIKFKGLIGLHTYLFKSTGYLQGAFIISLFLSGFYPALFYICMIVGILACAEEIIIILLLKQRQTNVKGLYWVLKNKVH